MACPLQLDLDQFDTEQSLMEQIEGDAALMAMISEMFFEQHYNDFDVRFFSPSAAWLACMGITCFFEQHFGGCSVCPPRPMVVAKCQARHL